MNDTIDVFYTSASFSNRDHITSLLNAAEDLALIGSSRPRKASVMCATLQPDIVLFDVAVPDPDDIKVIKSIFSKLSGVRVLILAQFDNPSWAQTMLKIGVSGYLLYSSDLSDLAISIRTVHSGKVVCSSTIISALIQPRDTLKTNEPSSASGWGA